MGDGGLGIEGDEREWGGLGLGRVGWGARWNHCTYIYTSFRRCCERGNGKERTERLGSRKR